VGTRSATRYGLGVAAQLGAELSTAGVAVLSGLALGIDGAAHEGASAGWHADHDTAAPPVGVVAGGLGTPYPRHHAGLWRRVAEAGVILSESAAGATVPRWRFPQRNRILAALADVVVVVECHSRGGSLHPVRAAERRGVSVGAVPGSVRSPASAGTNDLLADGCFVVRDAADVLVAVGLARAGAVPVRTGRRREVERAGAPLTAPTVSSSVGAVIAAAVRGAGGPVQPEGAAITADPPADPDPDAAVLKALDWEPCSVEQVLRRSGLALGTVWASLERLRQEGRIRGDAGWWGRV
jgi:DNA processing protein